ncbi:MAG: GNAT family N-acetyltransferase [Clostridia bacterium]
MKNYIIRKAKFEDIDNIWNLGKNINEFETSEDIVLFWAKDILENCIDKKDVMILVIEIKEKIVGFMIANINGSLKKAEIENQYIISEYRHNGYGKALLTQMIEDLSNVGVENICAMSTDAVDFLVRNGFTKGNQFYWMDLALSERFKK